MRVIEQVITIETDEQVPVVSRRSGINPVTIYSSWVRIHRIEQGHPEEPKVIIEVRIPEIEDGWVVVHVVNGEEMIRRGEQPDVVYIREVVPEGHWHKI